MKKIALLLFTAASTMANAQSIGIGTTTPNTNAALDIESTTKGLLIPRLSTAARNAITATKGLMVFDLTTNSFWFHTGAEWSELATTANTWSLNGNMSVAPGQYFGIFANQPLEIRLGEQRAARLDQVNRNYTIGLRALDAPTTATGNIAIGQGALHNNKILNDLVAIGDSALFFAGSNLQPFFDGTANTAIGKMALYGNQNGAQNTAIGYRTMAGGFTGLASTSVGAEALNKGGGGQNTAIGARALFNNTTGGSNTAAGAYTMTANTTGQRNVAMGTSSLANNTIGSHNTAIGSSALNANTTGNENVAVGSGALLRAQTALRNTAVGYATLSSNISGSSNSALGYESLRQSHGSGNTAVGAFALQVNGSGDNNTAVGLRALEENTFGLTNTAVGASALQSNTNGTSRTAVGYLANSSGTSFNNNTAIGFFTTCTASNQVRLGNSQVTSIGGVVGWTTLSDSRFKTNERSDVQGLAFINGLRPVSYNLNTAELENFKASHYGKKAAPDAISKSGINNTRFTGFNAQEVEQLARQLGFEFSGIDAPKNEGDYYGLRYGDFVVPLVKAIQEQQTIIDNLQRQINELKKMITK